MPVQDEKFRDRDRKAAVNERFNGPEETQNFLNAIEAISPHTQLRCVAVISDWS